MKENGRERGRKGKGINRKRRERGRKKKGKRSEAPYNSYFWLRNRS